jgi:hypothetical protein
MKFPTCPVLSSLVALVVATRAVDAFAENWPTWRGPTGVGISMESDLPTQWSATDNIRWKVALPEPGNSTPIVWGNRIFVTQALEK